MTTAKDRAFERAVRGYMATHNVPLNVARRALRRQDAPVLHNRVGVAAAAVAAPRGLDGMVEAMFRLAGRSTPPPGIGRRLAATLMESLDTVFS